MCKRKVKGLLFGLLVASMAMPAYAQTEPAQQTDFVLSDWRQKQKEKPAIIEMAVEGAAVRDNQDQAQSRVDLDRLTRAENRLDALRAQLVNLQMREIELKARLDELDYQMRPASIQRALAFVGSARPMDELRDNLRARLESEKSRTKEQLELLASALTKLEAAIFDLDAECTRLRQRLRLSSEADGAR